MSQLSYLVILEEEYSRPDKPDYQHVKHHLPHAKQIKDWLPKEWDDCNIPSCFDGILKDKVQACPMRIKELNDGRLCAYISIQFIPGFRLTKNRREECWEQMDGQWTDGFGETIDFHPIPNEPGWILRI